MISTIPFAIGFLIYAIFCVFTFDIFTKKKIDFQNLGLIFIYLFYSTLAVYMIFTVDLKGNFIERIIQSGIYTGACGIALIFYYNMIISKKDDTEEVNESYGKVKDKISDF